MNQNSTEVFYTNMVTSTSCKVFWQQMTWKKSVRCSKTVNNVPVLLSDIATVQIGLKEPKLGLASERAKPAVLVTITKQPNTGYEHTDKLNPTEQTINIGHRPTKDITVWRENLPTYSVNPALSKVLSLTYRKHYSKGHFVIKACFFFFLIWSDALPRFADCYPPCWLQSTLHGLGLTINTMSLGGLAIAIVHSWMMPLSTWRTCTSAYGKSIKACGRLSSLKSCSRPLHGTYANSELDTNHQARGCFLPLFFLSGMEGRMLIPLNRIHRGPVRLNRSSIDFDPGIMAAC